MPTILLILNGGVSLRFIAIIGTWVDDLVRIPSDDTLVEEEVEKYVELEH